MQRNAPIMPPHTGLALTDIGPVPCPSSMTTADTHTASHLISPLGRDHPALSWEGAGTAVGFSVCVWRAFSTALVKRSTSMLVIYAFNHTPVPSVFEIGGKGYSLIRMASADFNVPGGFVCAAQFFDDWTRELEAGPAWTRVQDELSYGAPSEASVIALKDQIDGLLFSPSQSKAIETAMAEMTSGGVCAVRSSSPEEDLEGSSFAGMYESLLGVPTEGLAEAIRTVFKSAFDERVFSYKKTKGFDTTTVRIAVIVMEQVPSETAGVGFSVNPINNDYDEAVLNANYGLGESAVSGGVTPDFSSWIRSTARWFRKRWATRRNLLCWTRLVAWRSRVVVLRIPSASPTHRRKRSHK